MGEKKLLNIFRNNEIPVEKELLDQTELEIIDFSKGEDLDGLGEKDYIFTNFNDYDYISDVHLIRKNDIKMISSENVLNMKTFIEAGGRAIIPPDWFKTEGISKSIIQRFFGNDASIHLSDLADNTEITRYELFEHLRIGEISDEIVIRSFAKGFNPVAVRDWIEHVCYFAFYLHQAGFGSIPIELSNMQNDDELTMSITMNAADLSLSNFTNSFGHVNPDYPLYSLLETARISAHLFSIALYKDSGKINFTAYWHKDLERPHQKEQCFIIHEIDSSDILEGKNAHPIVQTLELLEAELEELEKESNESELPGNIIELMASGAYVEENVQNVALKVQEKIQEKLDSGDPLNLLEDEIINIKEELLNSPEAHLYEPFPDAEEVAQHIKRSDYKKNDEIERIRSEHGEDDDIIVKGQKILDDDLAQKISSGLEDEAANSFVSSFLEDLDEAQKIHGQDQDQDISQVIKGFQEDLDDELSLISNQEDKFEKSLKKHFLSEIKNEDDILKLKSNDFFSSEDFKMKLTGSIAKSVKETYKVSKVNPETIKNTEESMIKSLQSTFSVSREEAKQLVKGSFEKFKKEEVEFVKSKLLDEVNNQEVKESYIKKSALKSLDQEKKKNEELQSQNQLLRAQMKSLESQRVDKVDFQKKVKKQILDIEKRAKVAISKSNEQGQDLNSDLATELLEVKQKMQMIQKEFQIKNDQLLKKVHEHESTIAAKDLLISKINQENIKKLSKKEQEILSLKEQARAALKNVNYGTDEDSKIRIEKLEIDKQELNQVIDSQKAEIKNLENKVIDERDKRLDEREVKSKINRLEKENSAAQAIINRLRKDMGQSHKVVDRQQDQISDFRQIKATDNSEMSKLKETNRKLEHRLKEIENKKQLESTPEVDRIKASKKHLEKKYKILEQKNHQLSSRIEKQKAVPKVVEKDPTLDLKLKKFEQAQKKLTKDLAFANNQLALSKKDMIKFKNQENALKLKISQLEKELEKNKKSAA